MDKHATICNNNNDRWLKKKEKEIKVIPSTQRLSFRRTGKYRRGLTISKDAFYKMDDVTITPGMRIELEPNVWLINYGVHINLVKYCMTADNKRCDGGFFSFKPSEWRDFWTNIRPKIMASYDR